MRRLDSQRYKPQAHVIHKAASCEMTNDHTRHRDQVPARGTFTESKTLQTMMQQDIVLQHTWPAKLPAGLPLDLSVAAAPAVTQQHHVHWQLPSNDWQLLL
jgi:hypothetical protein